MEDRQTLGTGLECLPGVQVPLTRGSKQKHFFCIFKAKAFWDVDFFFFTGVFLLAHCLSDWYLCGLISKLLQVHSADNLQPNPQIHYETSTVLQVRTENIRASQTIILLETTEKVTESSFLISLSKKKKPICK